MSNGKIINCLKKILLQVDKLGDMHRAIYDPNFDGIVKNSDKLEGSTKSQVRVHTPKAHTLDSHSEKKLDQLGEKTSGSGVTVDGCLIKDGKAGDSQKLEGSTKTQVQDHTPKAHTLDSHSEKKLDQLGEKTSGSGVTVDECLIKDGKAGDSQKLGGSTKTQVQDHTPKAHTLASHSSKTHSELTEVSADQHHSQAHTHPPDWDSGWVSVEFEAVHTFTHNLGTRALLAQIYARTNSASSWTLFGSTVTLQAWHNTDNSMQLFNGWETKEIRVFLWKI